MTEEEKRRYRELDADRLPDPNTYEGRPWYHVPVFDTPTMWDDDPYDVEVRTYRLHRTSNPKAAYWWPEG